MSEAQHGRGPYAVGVARRQSIVREATHAFASMGYNGATMREIADRVGVSAAAISRHFSSKEDLLVAVLDYWEGETAKLANPLATGLDYWASFRASTQYHEQHRGLLQLFLTVSVDATSDAYPAVEKVRNRYAGTRGELVRHLRSARDAERIRWLTDADIEAEARAFIAFLDGIELQFLLQDSVDMVAMFDHHWKRLLRDWEAR